jgi:hypothetical protein
VCVEAHRPQNQVQDPGGWSSALSSPPLSSLHSHHHHPFRNHNSTFQTHLACTPISTHTSFPSPLFVQPLAHRPPKPLLAFPRISLPSIFRCEGGSVRTMGGLLSPTLQPTDPTTLEGRIMSIDHDVKFARGPSSASQPGSAALLAGASPSSDDDSPDHDQDQDMDLPDEPDRDGHLDGQPGSSALQQPPQPPKRKGGRKPVGYSSSNPPDPSSRAIDIRHLGGAQAEEPPGAGRFPRAQDRVHQAARGHHKAPRG